MVNEDGLWRGTWVAAQKPSDSIWQDKPACWYHRGEKIAKLIIFESELAVS